MKICDNPKLINDKAIDVLVDVARRSAPNGWKLNEDMAWVRTKCKEVLKHDGVCLFRTHTQCPYACINHEVCRCEMYEPSK